MSGLFLFESSNVSQIQLSDFIQLPIKKDITMSGVLVSISGICETYEDKGSDYAAEGSVPIPEWSGAGQS